MAREANAAAPPSHPCRRSGIRCPGARPSGPRPVRGVRHGLQPEPKWCPLFRAWSSWSPVNPDDRLLVPPYRLVVHTWAARLWRWRQAPGSPALPCHRDRQAALRQGRDYAGTVPADSRRHTPLQVRARLRGLIRSCLMVQLCTPLATSDHHRGASPTSRYHARA